MVSLVLVVGLAGCSGAKGHLAYEGSYVEGCSCSPPCPCELTGLKMGCQGVGGFSIARGTFQGKDLAGVKMAYATSPGSWVVCYVDAPNAAKLSAGSDLMRAAFSGWGKMGPVKAAHISIQGSQGAYSLAVDGGKVMSLKTAPFYGLDKSKPVTYSNIHDPLHPVVMQAKTVTCSFHDGEKTFELKDSNAYYNPAIKTHGDLAVR